jgi:hypothetical protein
MHCSSHLRGILFIFILMFLPPSSGRAQDCSTVNCRTVVDSIDNLKNDTGGYSGAAYAKITVTCYHTASPKIPCAGGGDFDRVTYAMGTGDCNSPSQDNNGTIIQDKNHNCFFRKNWALNGVIDARQCGVAGGGSVDDTNALNQCLSLAVADASTGRPAVPIVNTGGGQVRIDTGDILIPGGVTLSCGGGSAVGQVLDSDYRAVQNAIWLYNDSSTGGTHLRIIGSTANAAAAGVTGCVILRGNGPNTTTPFDYAPNKFLPASLRDALTEVSKFTGTAIVANTESFSVTNTTILGFDTCWTNVDGMIGGNRVILDHVNCDGSAGFHVEKGGGGAQFDDLNVRSFLTGGAISGCTHCDEYTFSGGTGRGDIVGPLSQSTSGAYQVMIDDSGPSPVIVPQTGDVFWVRTPTTAAQSAGGKHTVGTVTTTSMSPCLHTCALFDLSDTVYSDSTHHLAGTATTTAGSSMITGVVMTTPGANLGTLAVGMNVGGSACIASGATIVAIEPDWGTVWITPNKTASCSSPGGNIEFWDNADTTTSVAQLTYSSQIRAKPAYEILGSAGSTFSGCHSSNHVTGFHAGGGSGLNRFVNCINENDHDLEDDELYGLVCDIDCGGVDWVNGVLGQHSTGAIKVQTTSNKPVHVTNVGLGPSSGRRSGRYAEVMGGTLSIENSAADVPGNLFVWGGGAHLTMSGLYVPNGTLYQQDATAFANTTGCGNTFSGPTPYSCTPPIVAPRPGGRLSLTAYSATPPSGAVMTSDVSAGTSIYYVPYVTQAVPIWNGHVFAAVDIGGAGLAFALDPGVETAGKNYDLFVENSRNATLEMCAGPAWSNTTTRSAGIVKLNGIWVNSAATACNHPSNPFTCAPDFCTYLGTMYAVAAGQATMQAGPASATDGPSLCVCLYNAYNRVSVTAEGHDTHAAYATVVVLSGWHPLNSLRQGGVADGVHASNSITVLDGLGEMSMEAQLTDAMKAGAGNAAQIGIDVDSTSTTPLYIAATPATTNALPFGAVLRVPPSPGLRFVQPMEYDTTAAPPTYGGAAAQVFSISVDD